jgi:hypothetical protein
LKLGGDVVGHDESTAAKNRCNSAKDSEECGNGDEVQLIQESKSHKGRDINVEYNQQHFCNWEKDLSVRSIIERIDQKCGSVDHAMRHEPK